MHTYTGYEQELIQCEGKHSFLYSLDGKQFMETCPKKKNIGDYPVWVKYNEKIYPFICTIQMDWKKDYNTDYLSEKDFVGDFSVSSNLPVTYTLKNPDHILAKIDAKTGILTMKEAGIVTVVAETENQWIQKEFILKRKDALSFEKESIQAHCRDTGLIPSQKANYTKVNKRYRDKIVYSLEEINSGYEVNQNTGEIKVKNIEKVLNTGDTILNVVAKNKGNQVVDPSRCVYQIKILFKKGKAPYCIEKMDKKEGWCASLKVTASPGLLISKDGMHFKKTMEWKEDGKYENVLLYGKDDQGYYVSLPSLPAFKIDNQPPKIKKIEYEGSVEKNKIIGFPGNHEMKVKLKGEDQLSNVCFCTWYWNHTYLGNGFEISIPEGKGYVSVKIEDEAGNETFFHEEKECIIDGTNPMAFISYSKPLGREIPVEIRMEEANFCKEDVHVFVKNIENSKKTEISDLTWEENKAQFNIKKEGTYRVDVDYKDICQNPVVVEGNKQNITLDYTRPKIENISEYESYNNKPVIIRFEVKEKHFDPSLFQVWINGKKEKIDWNGKWGSFNLSKEGEYTFKITGKDELDNPVQKEYESSKIILDWRKPKLFTKIIGNPYQKQKVFIDVEEDYFKIGKMINKHSGEIIKFKESKSAFNFDSDGIYDLWVQLEDECGNKTVKKVKKFIIDTTSPVISAIQYDSKKSKDSIRVHVIASDSLSSIKKYRYKMNGKVYESQSPDFQISNQEFDGKIAYQTVDQANNESKWFQDDQKITLDHKKPVCEVKWNPFLTKKKGVYIFNTNAVFEAHIRDLHLEKVRTSYTFNGVRKEMSSKKDIYQSFDQEGKYQVFIQAIDSCGNRMEEYVSPLFIVDKKVTEPKVWINGSHHVNTDTNGNLQLKVKITDLTLDHCAYSLKKQYIHTSEDVTNHWKRTCHKVKNGEEWIFENQPFSLDHDGKYEFCIYVQDQAHPKKKFTYNFSMNHYGSVFQLDTRTEQEIKKEYISTLKNNIQVRVWNPGKIKDESCKVEILQDGIPMNSVHYMYKKISDSEGVYVISKHNFIEDGQYKIMIFGEDDLNHFCESQNKLSFCIDSHPPKFNVLDHTKKKTKISIEDLYGMKYVKVWNHKKILLDKNLRGIEKKKLTIPSSSFSIEVMDQSGNCTKEHIEKKIVKKDSKKSFPTFVFLFFILIFLISIRVKSLRIRKN